MNAEQLNQLSEAIIGACIEVHRTLGPGLLESAYEECLCHELSQRNIPFQRQVPVPVRYKSVLLDCAYKIDVLAASAIVVELKSVERIEPVHEAQLLTYLRLRGCSVGLLINFNVPMLKLGIHRRVLNFDDDSRNEFSLSASSASPR